MFGALLLCLMVATTSLAAGTWAHREVRTKLDGTWIVEFTRNGSGEIQTVHFSRKVGDGSEQLNLKKWNLELAYEKLTTFCDNKGFDECDDILRALIIGIRNNPNLTVQQAVTWYDNNYPDSPWKGIKILEYMQQPIRRHKFRW